METRRTEILDWSCLLRSEDRSCLHHFTAEEHTRERPEDHEEREMGNKDRTRRR